MEKKNTGILTPEGVQKALTEIYKAVNNGVTNVIPPVSKMADDYLVKETDPRKAASKMIALQTTKSAVSGFVTGFGGFVTMPVTLPANITSVLAVQMRMIAGIAYMAGYDICCDQVQTLIYACLAGVSVSEVIKKASITFGVKFTKNMVKKIPGKVLVKINQKVGFRFVTKFGTKGIINIGKAVPVVGALVGGGFDLVETKVIANRAMKMFFDNDYSVGTNEKDDCVIIDDVDWQEENNDDAVIEDITEEN